MSNALHVQRKAGIANSPIAVTGKESSVRFVLGRFMTVLLSGSDFWDADDHVLYPATAGLACLVTVWAFLRITAPRTLAPWTLFDYTCTVTLGASLSRVLVGPSSFVNDGRVNSSLTLVRGVIAMATIIFVPWAYTFILAHVPGSERFLRAQPLLIAFRGHLLHDEMRSHRISVSDVRMAMRTKGVGRLCDVEAMVVESTGVVSVVTRNMGTEALEGLKAYQNLVSKNLGHQPTPSASGDPVSERGLGKA